MPFLSLNDMGKDLPDYEEIPIPVEMPEDVRDAYKEAERKIRQVLKSDRKAAQKLLSAYMGQNLGADALTGEQLQQLLLGIGTGPAGVDDPLRGGASRHERRKGPDLPDGEGAGAGHQGQCGGYCRRIQENGKDSWFSSTGFFFDFFFLRSSNVRCRSPS